MFPIEGNKRASLSFFILLLLVIVPELSFSEANECRKADSDAVCFVPDLCTSHCQDKGYTHGKCGWCLNIPPRCCFCYKPCPSTQSTPSIGG